jgi:hypothetical protein
LKKFAYFSNRSYCDCTVFAVLILCAHIFDAYTYVKCDAVYEKNGRLTIVDWKTGNGSESDLEQVLLYVFLVSRLYTVPVEQIEARLEYLYDGDCAIYNFNCKDMEYAEEIIKSGIIDLQSCLSNPEKGIPFPEIYFQQNKSTKCRFCNFREICFHETLPSNVNSEHQKGAVLIPV